MSTVRTLARHTLIYGLSSVIGRVVNFLLTPVYANVFSTSDYGLLSDLYALLAYPLVVLTFGMETSLFRFAEADLGGGKRISSEQTYTNAIVLVGGLGFIAALVGWFAAAPIAVLLEYPGRGDLVRVLVLITLADVWAAVPMARLRQREQAMRFASLALANILLTVVLNLIFLFALGWGLEAVFYANLIASVLRLAGALVDNLPSSWRADAATTRQMAHYGFYITLAGLGGQLNEMLDKNLLPRLWPDGQRFAGRPRTGLDMNGIYAVNYKLGMFIVLASQAFRYAIEPYFLRQQVADEAAHRAAQARAFHYFMLTGVFTLLAITAFAPELQHMLFPERYWLGLPVVPIVLLANLCLAAYTSFSIWFKRTSQLRFGLLFVGIGLLLTLVLNPLLIPVLGYIGCALAHLACYAAMAAACYAVGQHYCPVPYKLRRLLSYVGIVGLALIALHFLALGPRGAHPSWVLWKAAVVLVVSVGVAAYERLRPPSFSAA